MGDVLLPTMEKAFDLSKKLFQGGAVHPAGSGQICRISEIVPGDADIYRSVVAMEAWRASPLVSPRISASQRW
jgi:hypothetical protein